MSIEIYNITPVIDHIGAYLKGKLNDRLVKNFTCSNNKIKEAKSANINIKYKNTNISGYNHRIIDLSANGFHSFEIVYEDYGILPNFVNEIPAANIIIEVFLSVMQFDLNGLRYSIQDNKIFSKDLFDPDIEGLEQVEDDNDTVGNCAKYKKTYKIELKFNK